jgi:hypothetical protein
MKAYNHLVIIHLLIKFFQGCNGFTATWKNTAFLTKRVTRKDSSRFPLFSSREEVQAVTSASTRKSKPEVSFPYDSQKIRNFSIIAHIDQ